MKLLIKTLYKKTLTWYLFIKKNLFIIVSLTTILVFFILTVRGAFTIWFIPVLEPIADDKPISYYLPMTLHQAQDFLNDCSKVFDKYVPATNIFILWMYANYPDYISFDSLHRPYYLISEDLINAFITQNGLIPDQVDLILKNADPMLYGAIQPNRQIMEEVIGCNDLNLKILEKKLNYYNDTIIGSIIIIAGLTIYVGIRYITG